MLQISIIQLTPAIRWYEVFFYSIISFRIFFIEAYFKEEFLPNLNQHADVVLGYIKFTSARRARRTHK